MRDPLTVAAAQPPCVARDVAANVAAHAAAVRIARSRVVVFPELSLTGYELDAPTLALDDARLAPLVAACAETGSTALVGAPIEGEADRPHIAMLAVDGGGVRVAYRKVWVAADEAVRFAPGTEPQTIEVDGWRLGLGVCRDTGIPQHWSDTAALDVDAYLAGTLMGADETAEQNDRARRIATAHQLWVVFASFAGPTGSGYRKTAGRSGVWSPGGALVAQAGPEPGAVVRATLR